MCTCTAGRFIYAVKLLTLLAGSQEAIANISRGTAKYTIFCVGDSITEGFGASDEDQSSYPAQLQKMLGADYHVVNYGDGGATARKRRGVALNEFFVREHFHHSYWDSDFFRSAVTARASADAVVIMFGTNDSREWNWKYANRTKFMEEFRSDYVALVRHFQDSPSRPMVYLMIPPPIYMDGIWMGPLEGKYHGMNQTFVNTVLPTEIPLLAQKTGTKVAANLVSAFAEYCPDFNNQVCQLMGTTPEPYCSLGMPPNSLCHNGTQHSDSCHPDDAGYNLIAEAVFRALQKDFPEVGYRIMFS